MSSILDIYLLYTGSVGSVINDLGYALRYDDLRGFRTLVSAREFILFSQPIKLLTI